MCPIRGGQRAAASYTGHKKETVSVAHRGFTRHSKSLVRGRPCGVQRTQIGVRRASAFGGTASSSPLVRDALGKKRAHENALRAVASASDDDPSSLAAYRTERKSMSESPPRYEAEQPIGEPCTSIPPRATKVCVKNEKGEFRGWSAEGREEGHVQMLTITKNKNGSGWFEEARLADCSVMTSSANESWKQQQQQQPQPQQQKQQRKTQCPHDKVGCCPSRLCAACRTGVSAAAVAAPAIGRAVPGMQTQRRNSPSKGERVEPRAPKRVCPAAPAARAASTRPSWDNKRIEAVFAEAQLSRKAKPIPIYPASEIKSLLGRLTCGPSSEVEQTIRFERDMQTEISHQLRTEAPQLFLERMLGRITSMIEKDDYAPQLVRLRGPDDRYKLDDAPTDLAGMFTQLEPLCSDVEPTMDEFHIYRKHNSSGRYDCARSKSFAPMVTNRALVVGESNEYGSVVLNARVRRKSSLHDTCAELGSQLRTTTIFSEDDWTFGRAIAHGEFDDRWYLILGWNGGLTPTHTDVGCQAVLYHTAAGMNQFLGVPRRVAVVLHQVRDALETKVPSPSLAGFESEILRRCLSFGKLQYGACRPSNLDLRA